MRPNLWVIASISSRLLLTRKWPQATARGESALTTAQCAFHTTSLFLDPEASGVGTMAGPEETSQDVPSRMNYHPSVKERDIQNRDSLPLPGAHSPLEFLEAHHFGGFLGLHQKETIRILRP